MISFSMLCKRKGLREREKAKREGKRGVGEREVREGYERAKEIKNRERERNNKN
jgi:hypothetical protein